MCIVTGIGHGSQFRGLYLVNFSCFLWLTEFERFLNRLRFHLLGKFAVTVVSEGKISKTTLPMHHWRQWTVSACATYSFINFCLFSSLLIYIIVSSLSSYLNIYDVFFVIFCLRWGGGGEGRGGNFSLWKWASVASICILSLSPSPFPALFRHSSLTNIHSTVLSESKCRVP